MEGEEVLFDIFDLKEFFTNIPRAEMLAAVDIYVRSTLNTYPGWKYF